MEGEASDIRQVYLMISKSTLSLGLQAAYLIISLVLAVGCGLLLIYLVCKNKYLRKARHYLRCNLALDDIIFTVCMISTELCLLFDQDGSHFQEACWTQKLVGIHSLASMFGTYLLMAVELYYFICQPLHYNSKVTTKRIVFGILGARAFALLFGAGSAIIDRLQNSEDSLKCDIESSTSTNTAAIFRSICYVVAIVATIAIIIIYGLVIKEARKQQERDENRNLWLCQTKAFKTMAPHVTILAVLVASVIFLIVFSRVLSNKYKKGSFSLLITYQVAKLIYLTLSSVVNPIIYSFRHQEFRLALRELCGMTQNMPAAMAPPPVQRGQDMEMAVFSNPNSGQWASHQELLSATSSSQEEGELEEEEHPPSPAQTQAEEHGQQTPPPSPAQTQAEVHGQQALPSSPAQTQTEEHVQQTPPPSPAQIQAEEQQQPEQAPPGLPGRCCQEKTQHRQLTVIIVQAEVHPSPPPCP